MGKWLPGCVQWKSNLLTDVVQTDVKRKRLVDKIGGMSETDRDGVRL